MRHQVMIFGTVLIFLVCAAMLGFAQDAQEWFDRASDAFDEGNYVRAIEYYGRTVELDPEYGYAYNNRAWAYYFLGRYDEALADLDRALKLGPVDAPAYYGRGVVYEQLGRYEEAVGDYTSAIEFDPGYALAYNNRAWVYNLMGDHTRALEDVERAMEPIDEDNSFVLPLTYNTRGSIYRELERYDEAMADIERAIELNPDYYYAYYSRGLMCEELGKRKKAKADFAYACDRGIPEACDALNEPGR